MQYTMKMSECNSMELIKMSKTNESNCFLRFSEESDLSYASTDDGESSSSSLSWLSEIADSHGVMPSPCSFLAAVGKLRYFKKLNNSQATDHGHYGTSKSFALDLPQLLASKFTNGKHVITANSYRRPCVDGGASLLEEDKRRSRL